MKADSPMSEERPVERESARTEFSREVGTKAARKLKAQRTPLRSVWLGFGVTGVIGWSIAAPAVLGALIGLWLDRRYPGVHSWTLMLLVAGLCIGCFQAWNWISKEDKAMHEDTALGEEQKDENNDQ